MDPTDVLFKSNYIFETGSYGRSVSDERWEKLDPEYITVWKSALSLLKSRTLQLQNCAVEIRADWSSILKKHERHYAVMKRIRQGFKDEKELTSILGGFPKQSAKVKLVTGVVSDDDRTTGLLGSAVESYLHDVFLLLNLCAPGSCDFYRGTLLEIDAKRELGRDISLSNVYFELALLGSFKIHWPRIETLSLPQTIRWFNSVRVDFHQLPQNPMEKVLFALLHISKLNIDPMIVIWLFYAFESLFQTKAGENFSSLTLSIATFLELDAKQTKTLRSKFRSLYEIRSAIVHGGFEVSHPMHNEALDKRVDENFRRISEAAEYGLTVLIAAVQSSIVREWKYPSFTERIHGVPIDPS